MKSFISIILLLLSGGAAAATLDFNEFTPGYVTPVLQSNGFELDGYTDFTDETIVTTLLGSPAVACKGTTNFEGDPGCWITLRRTDGQTFSLQSLNLLVSATADGQCSGCGEIWSASISGWTADGELLQESIFPAGGPFNGADPVVVSLDTSWTDLTTVRFFADTSGGYLNLDDISVSVVPIPAPLILFGSALVGLFWRTRTAV